MCGGIMPFLDLRQMDIDHKTVLVRVDMNVPVDEQGNVVEDNKIVASLPTIQHLLDRHAKVLLMTHLGRPKKRDEKFSTISIARRLSRLLFREVKHVDECVGEKVKQTVNNMKPGEVLFLENTRFFEQEKKNEEQFVKGLAELAEVYINECFGSSHRKHASTYGVPGLLPSCGGLCLRKEINTLQNMLSNTQRPFVAVLGGIKADKMKVLKNLLPKVDTVIVGGGLAMLIMKMQGHNIGNSKFDDQWLSEERQAELKSIINDPEQMKKIILPDDFVVTQEFKADVPSKIVEKHQVEDGWMALDIGPQTQKKFKEILEKAETIMWAGPMGVFEWDAFATGTKIIAQTMANNPGMTIVGGGQSAMAIEQFNCADRVTHVSTGGGAFLTYASKGTLPAVNRLKDFKELNEQTKRMERDTIY